VVTSVQHARLRRFSFIDSVHSRHLTTLLQQEVGLRRQLEDAARQQARTDELTGLPNRRRFFELAEREMVRAQRYGSPLAVVMLDLDHFKEINDNYGHAAGDQVLRAVGDCCRDVLRTNDVIGRLGGEEFAILLPATAMDGARLFAERLRVAVYECRIGLPGTELRLTATLGVAACAPGEVVTVDELLARADAALYRGKAGGRNRVEG
jgi:diguanylate cyclase (GGDEF)-like protein